MSANELLALGRTNPSDPNEGFCMTILALKLSRRANAVSSLHGQVSRAMWTPLFPGRSEEQVPIGHITNGIHVRTLARAADASALRQASRPGLDRAMLGAVHVGFHRRTSKTANCGRRARRSRPASSKRRGFAPSGAPTSAANRSSSSSRCGTRSASMRSRLGSRGASPPTSGRTSCCAIWRVSSAFVNDAKVPIQFVFAGKAHPRDVPGKEVLQQVFQLLRDSRFAGKLLFIEDYDINVGRYLVQGVDVWLNTPRRPLEASGTSGQKVVLNGGLNLSILDGWWAEAYDGHNGFAIGRGETHTSIERARRSRRRSARQGAARGSHTAVLRP